ncbi:DNA polymerase III subunit delta' [Bacillus sp. DTU_2020_1000418_1_SI_GHA_SEK_038]|uniref:DNA polymerase III subunit delta' n=1 Tax=Bacillus sp. DTU_2020_1000418_1_SI_GHA_SEK_038 TaxID=3077585 RepID=UPI0028F05A1E|nr:DNA polymerase III subunit delta' [Bacillus sp. DTU_2020_1000418_1_SI_GHA_SEK_038]WNS75530.1 DNA polymerase III subunit delta' [Bacillus sp. DTU_2020_1000418_1_SI_GHA_SEK_038]
MVKTWEDLEGMQPVVLKMFKNSILKDRLAHAYLFEGMKGTGKREAGSLLAKSVFCHSPIQGYMPCEACVNCKRINNGNHPDVHIVEPDGLSIKKAQIQSLQEEFSKTGVESKKKLYMIVHADRMTSNAANSLLKFLEEPHPHTMAILMTEQAQRILPTILSRCQTISFQTLSPEKMAEKLTMNGVSPQMAPLIAQLTNNIDEAIAYSQNDWFVQAQKIVLKLYEVLKKSPLEAMVALQDDWFKHFKEKEQLDLGLDLLLLISKDLLYIQLGKEGQIVYLNEKARLEQFALQSSSRQVSEQMTAILEAKRKLHANMNPQLLMEQLVLKLQEGSSFV